MTTVTGTNGNNGISGMTPTIGQNGGSATNSLNGTIGADSNIIAAIGGNGGIGGANLGTGPGANGGNGGSATTSVNGNIYNMPMSTTLAVTAAATGGTGGMGGLGTPAGTQGNGGNATVNFNGNIIQTSKNLTAITLQAIATAGVGAKDGNATATANGNIIQYNGAMATNVILDAIATDTMELPGFIGSAFGTKTATLNGNIIQGNVGSVTLMADATYANTTATISGNILTAKSTDTGVVMLEAMGQNIAITGNIVNLGKQDLDINLDELGPTYGTRVSGNIFNGTGSNNLVLTNTFNPGPSPGTDTAVVNLAAGTLTINGGTNIINRFGGIALTGNIAGNFIGTSGNNNLNAGGDTTTGTIIFQGNGGTDTLTGGPNALNVAYFAGSEWQYAITGTLPGDNVHPVTVVGGPTGNTSNDTLAGIQRLKFLNPANVSDVNDDGFGDLVLYNSTTGDLQVNLAGPPVTLGTPTITPGTVAPAYSSGFNAIGTGQFTPDTNRDASLLLQNATTGQLEIATNLAGTPAAPIAITGATPGLVTATTFTGWTAITAGDFNGDGASDVLLQQGAGGPVEIAFMNTIAGQQPGTVDQISAVTSPSGGNWNVVSSGDFNGDGNSDILWQNSTTGALDISLMNGATGTPTSVGTDPTGFTAIGTGDFNGDGKSDILFYDSATSQAEIWLMNGTSQVAGATPLVVNAPNTPADTYTLLGAEDINKDGISDLLWQGSAGNLVATEMTGTSNTVSVLNQNVNLGMTPSTSFHLVASTGGG